MIRMLRLYSAAVATVIIAVVAVLLYLHRSDETEKLIRSTQEKSILIARSVQTRLLEDDSFITPNAKKAFQAIFEALQKDTNLTRMDILQPTGDTLLTSDVETGQFPDQHREDFQRAQPGKPHSRIRDIHLTSREGGERQKKTWVETFVYLSNEKSNQQNIYFVSMDVTSQMTAEELDHTKLSGLAVLFMGILLLGLQFILRRTESIVVQREAMIEKRSAELSDFNDSLKKEAAIRRNAEQAFRESESRLRAVLNNAPSIIALKDLNGHFLMVNKRFEKVFDVSSQNIVGRTCYDMFDTAIAHRVHDNDLKVIDFHQVSEMEEVLPTALGEKTFFTVRFPLFNPDKSIYALCTISVDITERKLVEEELRESERSLSNAQRIAKLGNWHWDLKDNLFICSDETLRILGFGDEKIAMTNDCYEKSIHADDIEQVRHVARRALQDDAPYKVDFRIVWPDGTVRHVTAIGEVERDDHNKAIGLDVTLHDVTELKKAEEALRQSEERYRNFAADAAHELRTPLAILKLRLGELGDHDAAQALMHDVDGMHRLLEQLLALTKLDTLVIGPQDLVDLSALARDMAGFMAPIALKDKKMLEVIGGEEPVVIRGSEETLRQALRNLVENALRYTPSGGSVSLDISKEGILRIVDQGPGIAEDQLQNIFKRFLRADRNPGGGAGLGLSIVKRTVEAHGGTVKAENGKIRGAVFTLTFPLASDEPDNDSDGNGDGNGEDFEFSKASGS